LLAPRLPPKLEDHPLSAVCDCLFNIFAATLHIGGRSSIRNPRKRHAMMTGTHLPLTARDINCYSLSDVSLTRSPAAFSAQINLPDSPLKSGGQFMCNQL
jgi:hypothetical protein